MGFLFLENLSILIKNYLVMEENKEDTGVRKGFDLFNAYPFMSLQDSLNLTISKIPGTMCPVKSGVLY